MNRLKYWDGNHASIYPTSRYICHYYFTKLGLDLESTILGGKRFLSTLYAYASSSARSIECNGSRFPNQLLLLLLYKSFDINLFLHIQIIIYNIVTENHNSVHVERASLFLLKRTFMI